MSEMRIFLVDYDPRWVESFEQERALLEELLAPWRQGPIEHVGSTAVVGLCAKPVIDVMVGVKSLEDSRPAKAALEAAGYRYSDYKTDVEHWFCKPSFQHRTHHLHLIPFESPRWLDCLRFRDLLRSDTHVAASYAALKRDLAAKFEHDREAYTEGKGPFIARMLSERGETG